MATIGTGGDYATPQLWDDAAAATLTGVWLGEVLDEEIVVASQQLISGSTSTASAYKHLTAQAGASFIDHKDDAGFKLSYRGSTETLKGAAVHLDTFVSSQVSAINISEAHARVTRLQIKSTASFRLAANVQFNNAGAFIADCVLDGLIDSIAFDVDTGFAYNCLVVQRDDAEDIARNGYSGDLVNCLFVRIGAANGVGIARNGSATGTTVRNCAIFGATTPIDSSFATIENNATDQASIAGTNGVTSVPFDTTTFESITDDFRVKSGNPLEAAGTADAKSAADIFGAPWLTPRSIGVQEAVGGGGATVSPWVRANVILMPGLAG